MNYTLIPLLATLKKQEWKPLSRYILMHHSADSQIFQLFQYLESNKYNLQPLQEVEKWRSTVFPDSTIKSFTKLLSKLFLLTEDWLVQFYLLNNDMQKELMLNKIYNDRGLYNLADHKANKLQSRTSGFSQLSSQRISINAQLLHQQCYSDNPIKYKRGSTLQKDLFHQFLIDYKIQALIYLCEAHNWGRINNLDFNEEIRMFNKTIDLLPENELSITLEELLKVITALDLKAYLSLRQKLYDGRFEVPSELHTLVTIYLISFSIHLWRKGIYMDAEEHALLIEYGMTSGVLFSSGKIPATRFLNLLSTLGKLKTFEWNKEFIERWIDKVETKSLDSMLAFAQALNAFNFHKYELIEPLLRGIEFENYTEKIRALGLEMISLYIDRKDNYYILRNFIANYKRTLKRAADKMSAYNVKANLNLVKVIELLVQKDFLRLTIKMEKYDNIAYRTWITEEVNKRQSTA
jgi:hypothetical protein